MSPFAAAEITKDRLRLWQKRNEREQMACTPAVLVNIRHEEAHLGQVVLNITEDVSLEQVYALLVRAAADVAVEMKRGN